MQLAASCCESSGGHELATVPGKLQFLKGFGGGALDAFICALFIAPGALADADKDIRASRWFWWRTLCEAASICSTHA